MSSFSNKIIHIIGPGAAGKSTTGRNLAHRLSYHFVDLDEEYLKSLGDISDDVEQRGYEYYVAQNIGLYFKLIADLDVPAVFVLSSGFMTYNELIDSRTQATIERINIDRDTVLLLPSFNLEECVQETIKRQLARSYTSNNPSEHEAVIRKRFPIYNAMGSIRVETNQPSDKVIDTIINRLHLSLEAGSQ